MTPPSPSTVRFTILGAFGAGFGAPFRHPLQFIAIGLFVAVPVGVFVEWLLGHLLHSGIVLLDFVYAFSTLLILCLGLALVHVTTAWGIRAHMRREPILLRECFEHGFSALPRLLLVIGWLSAPCWVYPLERFFWRPHGITLEGFLTLFLLFIALAMVAPIATNERLSGVGLFRRAWRLYAGARWRGLAMIVLTLLVTLVVYCLLAATLNLSGVPPASGTQFALWCLAWTFASMPSAAAYYQHRRDEDGTEWAPVFD